MVYCRQCVNDPSRKNKEKRKEYLKQYKAKNHHKLVMTAKVYYQKNKDIIAEKTKESIKKNPVKFKNRQKIYVENNKIKVSKTQKLYRDKNKDRLKIYRIEYSNKNRDKISERNKLNRASINSSRLKRVNSDPLFKLSNTLRSRINCFIKSFGTSKKTTTKQLIGAEFSVVKKHIERQFKDGMTWNNHGIKGWHIDHVIPLSSAKTEDELLILFHYTNLQPLWSKDNFEKGCKIPPVQTKLTL